jgi:hypothetical protein
VPGTQRSGTSCDRNCDRLDTGRERTERFVEEPDRIITASRRADEALRINARGYDTVVRSRPFEHCKCTLVQRVAGVEPSDHDARIEY